MSSLQPCGASGRGSGASPQLSARKHVQLSSFRASRGFPRAFSRPSARVAPTRAPSRTTRNGSLKAAPPASEQARTSEGLWASGLQRTTAKRTFDIREAEADDYWDIAHVHVHSFYPLSDFVLVMFLRLDRVLALHLGKKIEESRKSSNGKYRCLIAAKPDWQPEEATLGNLALGAVERLAYASQGLKKEPETHVFAAIVVDTLMQYIPQRLRGPGPLATKAYISNLAVGNQLRRQGIGKALLTQAEQMAVHQWGCNEIFLHCDPNNTAAYNLYLRAGYSEIDATASSDKAAQPRKDVHLVLMRKPVADLHVVPTLSSPSTSTSTSTSSPPPQASAQEK